MRCCASKRSTSTRSEAGAPETPRAFPDEGVAAAMPAVKETPLHQSIRVVDSDDEPAGWPGTDPCTSDDGAARTSTSAFAEGCVAVDARFNTYAPKGGSDAPYTSDAEVDVVCCWCVGTHVASTSVTSDSGLAYQETAHGPNSFHLMRYKATGHASVMTLLAASSRLHAASVILATSWVSR